MLNYQIKFIDGRLTQVESDQLWSEWHNRNTGICCIILVIVGTNRLTIELLYSDPKFDFEQSDLLKSWYSTFLSFKQVTGCYNPNMFIITDESDIVHFKLQYA